MDRKSGPSLIERAAQRLADIKHEQAAEPTDPPPPSDVQAKPTEEDGGRTARPSDAPTAAVGPSRARGGARNITIDLDRLAAMGMITPRAERSRMTEEYRVIKRPILLRAFAAGEDAVKDANLIMITSAIPSEGKTFTAINLAMSIAKERDVYVLLVDADLSRPSIMSTLGVKADRGFVDLLEHEEMSVADVLLRTNISNLSVIPAGRPHAMGTELLASERAGQVIDEIAMRYSNRVIIFDTAPVLASSEGGALLKHVGQIVLVVEFERTKKAEVLGALDMLESCEYINLILNKSRTRLAAGHGGAGYYGSYYSSDG